MLTYETYLTIKPLIETRKLSYQEAYEVYGEKYKDIQAFRNRCSFLKRKWMEERSRCKKCGELVMNSGLQYFRDGYICSACLCPSYEATSIPNWNQSSINCEGA
jgi:formylmethanofuran dehydrogenase subunit E